MALNPTGLNTDFQSAAAGDPVIAAVIKQLNSGSGSASANSGYMTINEAVITTHSFDPWAEDIIATMAVRGSGQDNHGDDIASERSFDLTLKQMHKLAAQVPDGWKARFAVLRDTLDAAYVVEAARLAEERAQEVIATTRQMAKLATAITAPKSAKFSKKTGLGAVQVTDF